MIQVRRTGARRQKSAGCRCRRHHAREIDAAIAGG
jgi:hypothetical protein